MRSANENGGLTPPYILLLDNGEVPRYEEYISVIDVVLFPETMVPEDRENAKSLLYPMLEVFYTESVGTSLGDFKSSREKFHADPMGYVSEILNRPLQDLAAKAAKEPGKYLPALSRVMAESPWPDESLLDAIYKYGSPVAAAVTLGLVVLAMAAGYAVFNWKELEGHAAT